MPREQWEFYGRSRELESLEKILARKRWFFARITGRRRIGKTTLVQAALSAGPDRPVLYVQIPDSAPAGVLSAFADALQTFEIPADRFASPTSLRGLANTIGDMARAGFVIVLDEFQYFARSQLAEFTSHLQAVVDGLGAEASRVPGGLFVLGSLHTELVALLEDRSAPLYNRTTDNIELDHLDIASVLEILSVHADDDPQRLLFLWNLFEGVPKFYRDCFEHGVLGGERKQLLRAMFFRSSSPLRTEADNWFLSELRGRYDVVLKYVARNPGCTNGDIRAYAETTGSEKAEQVGGYLKILIDKYRMIERRLPIFAKPTARNGRYYIRDNFLRAWLAALKDQVAAVNFIPEQRLVERASERLEDVEGYGLERLVGQLYQERSREGVGDFPLSALIHGFWDKAGTEIDLVAVDADDQRLRLGSCKRNPAKLIRDLTSFDAHIGRFLELHERRYQGWTVERVAIAPDLDTASRKAIEAQGYIAQDLRDLTRELPRAPRR
jgi:uncharacterized protein